MNITWLFFFINGLISFFINQFKYVNLLPFIIIIVISIVLFFELSLINLPRKIYIILFFSFAFRIIILLFDTFGNEILILPGGGFSPDGFHLRAENAVLTGDFDGLNLYAFILSLIYYIFGPEAIIGRFFNLLLSISSILITYRTMSIHRLESKTKTVALSVMAFMPNYAIMSIVLRRESLIIFLLTLSMYNFSKWIVFNSKLSVIYSFIFGVLAAFFHSGSIIILVAYSIYLAFHNENLGKYTLRVRSIIILMVIILFFLFIFIVYGDSLTGKVSSIDSIDALFRYTEVADRGGSGYSVNLATGNSLLDFIINTPVRIFAYLLSPLPWQWRNFADVFAFLFSGVIYSTIIFMAIKELTNYNEKNRDIILFLLITVVLNVFVFSWGVSNSGTALRHRDKFIMIFVLLLSFLYENKIKRKKVLSKL